MASGSVDLVPEEQWRVAKVSYQYLTGGSTEMQLEVARENPAIVTGIRSKTTRANGVLFTLNRDATKISFDKRIPDREFRLVAFGLPEPSGVRPSRRWVNWAIAAGAIAMVVVGFILLRRK